MRPDLPLLNDPKARSILEELCNEHGITVELLEKLLSLQRNHLGKARQRGIAGDFSAILQDFLEERMEVGNATY